MSTLAIPAGLHQPVTASQVTTSPGKAPDVKYTDPAALNIVLDDFSRAEAWLSDNRWSLQWAESKILYQSPRGLATFEGSAGTVARSNISRFTVAKQVNSLAPAIHQGIFSDPIPFEVQPRPNTKQNAAYAWKHLLSVLLEECDFRQTMSIGIEAMVNQGTVIFKGGWEQKTVIRKHYVRKEAPPTVDLPIQTDPMKVTTEASDEFVVREDEQTSTRPWIEKCELGTVFVDPKWNKPNQLWKAKWVIHEHYVTYDDLKILAQDENYDIPDDEELRRIFMDDNGEQPVSIGAVESGLTETAGSAITSAERRDAITSEDPLLKPMQILERWTDDGCMVVLQKKVIIRNNRHNFSRHPFWSANMWNMEDTGYGMGVGRIVGADQRLEQGTVNAAVDIISMAVNPSYAVTRGPNAPTQNMRLRLGGIQLVDGDARTAFSLIEQPKVPSDVWTVTQMSNASSEAATGADQASVQGAMPGPKSSFGRSGTGAGILGKASSARIQAPLDRVVDGVMIPFLEFLFEEVRERMPVSEIRAILATSETKDLIADMQDFYDADLKFDTLAGARLAARTAMAAAIPFLLQVFENQQLIQQLNQTGYKIDAMQLVGMVMDVSGWKNARQIVVQMTPEEQQAMQQAQQGAQNAKLQQASQLSAQKHQQDSELEDQKIQGRIVAQTVKQAAGKMTDETPLDRAANFAERDANEHAMQQSQYFGGGQ